MPFRYLAPGGINSSPLNEDSDDSKVTLTEKKEHEWIAHGDTAAAAVADDDVGLVERVIGAPAHAFLPSSKADFGP